MAHFFSDSTIYFFLVILIISIIFAVITLIYIAKGISVKQSDFVLRLIIIQMAIATIIQNLSRVLLFILYNKNGLFGEKFCNTMEFLIETTTAIIPFLFSSYFITFYNLQISSSTFRISNKNLQIILFIINWILPIIYWAISIWSVESAFDEISTICNVQNTTMIMIHKGCGLFMSGLGVIFGILIKRHYAKGKMDSETKKNLKIYLGIIISYFSFFVLDVIFTSNFNMINGETENNQETTIQKFLNFYEWFRNFVCVILPVIFFIVFCFSMRRINKSVFTPTTISFNNNSIIGNDIGSENVLLESKAAINHYESEVCTDE